MARLIRRSEALRRINQLEEKAAAEGDKAGGDWVVRCFHAVMSCKVEDRIYCARCGKAVKADKIPDDGGGMILPGQMSIEDFI